MGNYAHGNQPIRHMIYLYNYAGVPYKTQEKVREVLTKLYQPFPDGYCGDEDNGQTSALYIFSSLGFYPVTPGINEYVIGSLFFEKATLQFPNNQNLIITSENNGLENRYIQSMKIGGIPYSKEYLEFEDLREGKAIHFEMGSLPNKRWGSKAEDAPYSLTRSRD